MGQTVGWIERLRNPPSPTSRWISQGLDPPYKDGVGGCYVEISAALRARWDLFFTVNLEDRSSSLLIDRIEDLRRAWGYAQDRHPFSTAAAVVLPDHLHCIWTLPPGVLNFSMRWRLLKSHFSRSLARAELAQAGRRAGERNVWQRRYWEHMIRDDADLARHVDYVHNNPVKHGYAGSVTDWEFSTYNSWNLHPGRKAE